jgi:hypothetical protein
MKRHIKIYGSNYCLCGLKLLTQTADDGAPDCMQCGYIAGGLLGMQSDSREFRKAVRKLKKRDI